MSIAENSSHLLILELSSRSPTTGGDGDHREVGAAGPSDGDGPAPPGLEGGSGALSRDRKALAASRVAESQPRQAPCLKRQ